MQKYTNVRTCLFRKKFEDENAEDIKCAIHILKTIFKSHPSNRLPPIVNLISKTLLFIPRRLYSVYEYFYSVYFYLYALFVPDHHGPYLRVPVDTTYIDVTFNVWAYSGSDVLWASIYLMKIFPVGRRKLNQRMIQQHGSMQLSLILVKTIS